MNTKMNVLKALGIIAVVAGHLEMGTFSWFPPYSFHMALFVFISGYFYKSENEKNAIDFLRNKIRSLVIPYFGWNFFYGIVTKMLKSVGLISYADHISINTLFIEPWITGHQFELNLAGWFVLTLFLIQITYVLIRRMLIASIKSEWILLLIFFCGGIISVYFAKSGYNSGIFLAFERVFFCLPFFQLGYVYRHKLETIDKFISSRWIMIVLLQCLMFSWDNIDYIMVFMSFPHPFIFAPFITSILGIYLYLHLAEMIDTVTKGKDKILSAIGNNTWSIMFHHIFIFWILNSIFYLLKKANIKNFSSFDVTLYNNDIWYKYLFAGEFTYLIYFLSGIFIPIGIKICIDRLVSKYFGYQHQTRNG